MTEKELKPYKLVNRLYTILILEGIELKYEDTENGISK